MSEEIEIQDIDGIGPTTERKMKEAGIDTVMDLAVATAEELSLELNCSKDAAATYIVSAQQLLRDSNILDKEFMTSEEAREKRKEVLRCSTGSIALNELLGGGIETRAVTEFYGEFGSGKSQICHTTSVLSTQPVEQGGLNGDVIYIDTEGTFRPERIDQIADNRGLDKMEISKRIYLCKVINSSHLELIVKDLAKYVKNYNAKLVIVDSIISLHRSEFAGRGTLADRQQRLNSIMHRLVRIAYAYNLAVIITNQVSASPDTFFGDPTRATGGHIVGHASTYRVYLRKSGDSRVAKMIDSPMHAYTDVKFTLNESGVDDTDEEKKKRAKEAKKEDG